VTKPIHWAVLRQRVRRLLQASWATAELRRLASVDGLTQIANRHTFDKRLHAEWIRACNSGLSLSLILCDIDFFKAYNDTYGHQMGDECLKRVAAWLQEAAQRPADIAARYGGEEFAILLPATDQAIAQTIAERLRITIEAAAIPHRASLFQCITISLGVASMAPSSISKPTQLVAEADKALYHAKAQGRNRVTVR
jgi:diguanylate cyclase (GGDEF)-like protein